MNLKSVSDGIEDKYDIRSGYDIKILKDAIIYNKRASFGKAFRGFISFF